MSQKHCPFCTIDGSRQQILWRYDRVYVMPSNPALVRHHLLVIPKRHVEFPENLSEAEWHKLWDVARTYQRKFLKLAPGMGCDLRQNTRPFLPQGDLKVDHVHVHVLPRMLGDELFEKCQHTEGGIFRKLSSEEIRQEVEFFEILRATS